MTENQEENKPTLPPEKDTLQSLGAEIKRAREARELSLNSASEAIRIAPKVLNAIENGTIDRGPAPVYMRGFVRSYVHFLGMDSPEFNERVHELYKAALGNEQKLKPCLPIQEHKETHTARNAFTLLVLIVGGYLLYTYYFMESPLFFESKEQTITENSEIAETTITESDQEKTDEEAVADEKAESKQSETVNDDSIIAESKTEGMETQATVADVIDEVVTAQTEESDVPLVSEDLSLVSPLEEPVQIEKMNLILEVTGDTWISMMVDGNNNEDMRLKKGDKYNWDAKQKYQLTIGNTELVRVLLNGKEIEMDRTKHLLTDWIVDASQLP